MTESPTPPSPTEPTEPAAISQVDMSYLQTLVGFNARMAALKVIGGFVPRMAGYGLRVVDFSILSLIHHNGGITSRQLCAVLNLQPPNLVGKIAAMERRGLLLRLPHPQDGRAIGLHMTAEGAAMMQEAEASARQLEDDVTATLTASERNTLVRLLCKVYS